MENFDILVCAGDVGAIQEKSCLGSVLGFSATVERVSCNVAANFDAVAFFEL